MLTYNTLINQFYFLSSNVEPMIIRINLILMKNHKQTLIIKYNVSKSENILNIDV